MNLDRPVDGWARVVLALLELGALVGGALAFLAVAVVLLASLRAPRPAEARVGSEG